ncbi:MAG: M61 family metallopeptidase [Bacteroidia bacterium]|nr:M61 family metallopeptidase [Bacteroidia bacterium]
MLKYHVSYTQPNNHFIDIEFIATVKDKKMIVQLPAWRPGRYELGNFAKNIQKWQAFDEKGSLLSFKKISKDTWEVDTDFAKELHIKYNYYAAEINAGSTFLDATQLYMNPVNCCLYLPERIGEPCELVLSIPDEYKVASGAIALNGKNGFSFNNFHELADSPFIASANLQHHLFATEGVEFNLWFQGECMPDWDKLTADFFKFCSHQLKMMQSFPVKAYHFLFQILPYKTYHGVEHITTTVIALGPGYGLMKGALYEDLLGVSSHELFHVWNVKTIRPIEMHPYDYSKENYSKLGYVCEGLTTYYGDYLLFRSGVFNEQQYFETFNERLQKHFDNFGRFNLSVAESSFDTWLDGYVPGIPNRKTNIYDEGNLLAFITDIFIRKKSANKNCLDDVMRYLYNEFALKNKGYSDLDYKGVVEHFANASYDAIFKNYINGTTDYEPLLRDAMEYIGCELAMQPSAKFHERSLGFKVIDAQGLIKVNAIYPLSVADNAGLTLNDEILAINHIQIKADGMAMGFTEWCNYFKNQELVLTVSTNGIIKHITCLAEDIASYYKNVKIQKSTTVSDVQKANFELWSLNKF